MVTERRCPKCGSALLPAQRFCRKCNFYCGPGKGSKKIKNKSAEKDLYGVVCRMCGKTTCFAGESYPVLCQSCLNPFDILRDKPYRLSERSEKTGDPAIKDMQHDHDPGKAGPFSKAVIDESRLALICTTAGALRRLIVPDSGSDISVGTAGDLESSFFCQRVFSGIEGVHFRLSHEVTGWYIEVTGQNMRVGDSELRMGDKTRIDNNEILTIGDNCLLRVELS